MRHFLGLREGSTRLAPSRTRARTGSRPTVEALEGRALLSFTTLDPSFGQGGTVVASGPYPTVESAVAVQPDGKIVAVGASFLIDIGYSLIVQRFNTNGTPDAGFGTAGEVIIIPPTGFGGNLASFVASKEVGLQPDGKMVLAAVFVTATPGTSSARETEIIRLGVDGKLDTTFGQGGKAVISSQNATLPALALQTDGKIVVAGHVSPTATSLPQAAVARLNANGTLDTTFGTGGLLALDPASSSSLQDVPAVAIDPSGKIVLAGSVTIVLFKPQTFAEVIRLNADGTPDTSFNQSGFERTSSNQTMTALAVQPDGKILVGGNAYNLTFQSPVLIRLNADGTTDPGFQSSFTIPSGPLSYQFAFQVSSLAVQPDGKILVGGVQPSTLRQSLAVIRFLPDGSKDPSFGLGDEATFRVAPAASGPFGISVTATAPGLAIAPDGKIVAAGNVPTTANSSPPTQSVVARLLPIAVSQITPGDYSGDGKADPAVFLTASALYAYRKSDGTGDVLQPFGIPGAGQTIPAPGDYDGTGTTEIAAYLSSIGSFAIRPSAGGPDRIILFGIAGAGQTIPTPGDYDGDGKTDLAVYLPSLGIFAYRPSSGGSDVLQSFGAPGTGQTIPAPGDYDGDGKTDIAAYLPVYGDFAVRYSGGGTDQLTPFGIAGAGQTIPVPGDYNGDGFSDLAVYLPSLGLFAYRPSNSYNAVDVVQTFGIPGAGATIPAPGDYDGDGRTDVAAYLPSLNLYAYRPTGGATDVVQPFGIAGASQTIPASAIAEAGQGGTVSAAAVSTDRVFVPLTDELMAIPGTTKRKAAGLNG